MELTVVYHRAKEMIRKEGWTEVRRFNKSGLTYLVIRKP